jgi:hypothetical protein
MKKIWMFLLVALLATGLVFVSCGDNGNGNGNGDDDFKISLFVRTKSGNNYAFAVSTPLEITENGDFFLEVTGISSNNNDLLIIAINDSGWDREDNPGGLSQAPDLLADAKITFTKLLINGTELTLKDNEDIDLDSSDGAWQGSVNIELWNGWEAGGQRIESATTEGDWGNDLPDVITSAVTSVRVEFTVSGVAED